MVECDVSWYFLDFWVSFRFELYTKRLISLFCVLLKNVKLWSSYYLLNKTFGFDNDTIK